MTLNAGNNEVYCGKNLEAIQLDNVSMPLKKNHVLQVLKNVRGNTLRKYSFLPEWTTICCPHSLSHSNFDTLLVLKKIWLYGIYEIPRILPGIWHIISKNIIVSVFF